MTEAEWLSCTDPQPMLKYLRRRASERKLRLFSVACCRQIWSLLDQIGKQAVECAERYADADATDDEQASMENLAWWGADGLNYEEDSIWLAGWAAHGAIDGSIETSALASALAAKAAGDKSAQEIQCQLLRDIICNPFHSIALNPSYLTWNDGTVVRLAQGVYESRILPGGTLENALLAVLTDAVEEAGNTDTVILDHLRGAGPHVRGCFVVDLLLGTE